MRWRLAVMTLGLLPLVACSDAVTPLATTSEPASDDIQPIVRLKPKYPSAALEQRLDGYVTLELTIGEAGVARDIEIVESSSSVFEDAAIESLRKWRYPAFAADGTPAIGRRVRETLRFSIAEP